MSEIKVVTLANLAEGAAAELFQEELNNVLRNIADVNTDAEATRKVTLEFRIVPSEDRQLGEVTIHASSKLAPYHVAKTRIFMNKHHGQNVAVENNPRQLEFEPAGHITPVKKEGDGA